MKKLFSNKRRGKILILLLLLAILLFGMIYSIVRQEELTVFSNEALLVYSIITNLYLFGLLFFAHGNYLLSYTWPLFKFRTYFEGRRRERVLFNILFLYGFYLFIFLFILFINKADLSTYLVVILLPILFVSILTRWYYLTRKRLKQVRSVSAKEQAQSFAAGKAAYGLNNY